MTQETHNRFRENLKDSQPRVDAVYRYLKDMNYNVTMPRLHVPDTFNDGIADSGDIILHYGPDDYRIEVKGQRKRTCEELLRFPTIIIDKKSTWDAKDPKPHAYYIVDKTLEHGLVFNCMRHWKHTTVRSFPDQVTGRMEPCYVAPRQFFSETRL